MSGKHTPGPWHRGNLTGSWVSVITPDNESGGSLTIAQVHVPARGPLRAMVGPSNARLIAAAPDLLAACAFTLDQFTQPYPRYDDALTTLRAAIAKAKGEVAP